MAERMVGGSVKVLLLAAAFILFGPMSDAAMARGSGGQASNACRTLAGSYLITITDSSGNFASREVLTLTVDGNALVVDSNEGGVSGVSNPFTSAQGAWSCTGGKQLSAVVTVLDFSLPGPVQSGQSIARLDYRMSRTGGPATIAGTVELRFFDLHGDPLTPPLPPPAAFTFSGTTITPGLPA